MHRCDARVFRWGNRSTNPSFTNITNTMQKMVCYSKRLWTWIFILSNQTHSFSSCSSSCFFPCSPSFFGISFNHICHWSIFPKTRSFGSYYVSDKVPLIFRMNCVYVYALGVKMMYEDCSHAVCVICWSVWHAVKLRVAGVIIGSTKHLSDRKLFLKQHAACVCVPECVRARVCVCFACRKIWVVPT